MHPIAAAAFALNPQPCLTRKVNGAQVVLTVRIIDGHSPSPPNFGKFCDPPFVGLESSLTSSPGP